MQPLSLLACLVLGSPSVLAQDLLVASRFTDQVLRYDATSGASLGVFAQGGGLDNPVGLTFGPDGHLYVASGESASILRYDGTSGAFLDLFAAGPELDQARQVNFGPDGALYVSSGSGDAVLRLDGTTGALLSVFAQGGGLDGPTSFTFGPDGHLYVGSVLTNRVLRFDGATGALLGVFADELLSFPHDIAFGPDGLVYVTNATSANDVLRFDATDGSLVDVFVIDPGLVTPLGLAWRRDGSLLVANQGQDQVRRYDGRTGQLLEVLVTTGSGGLDGPLFLAIAPETTGVSLWRATPGHAGETSWFALTGARPGGWVRVAFGLLPGQRAVPGCPGLAFEIAGPRPFATAVADEGGNALFLRALPAVLAGATLYLQAVDYGTCTISPLLVQAIP